MSEKLPKMPEPVVVATIHNTTVWGYTASQVLSLQRETWMRAMEVAAKECEAWGDARMPEFGGHALRNCAAAIRALPMPEGGE